MTKLNVSVNPIPKIKPYPVPFTLNDPQKIQFIITPHLKIFIDNTVLAAVDSDIAVAVLAIAAAAAVAVAAY